MFDLGKTANDILKVVAPVIGTALGGPLGGIAAKILSETLLGTSEASTEELAKAVMGASPEQLLAIKQAENAFKLKLRELDIEEERIAMQDRDSARARESSVKDAVPKILGSLIIAGFLSTVFLVLGGYVEGMKDPMTATTVGTLIGYVSSKADQIISYYFGSSSSSSKKNDMLIEAQKAFNKK